MRVKGTRSDAGRCSRHWELGRGEERSKGVHSRVCLGRGSGIGPRKWFGNRDGEWVKEWVRGNGSGTPKRKSDNLRNAFFYYQNMFVECLSVYLFLILVAVCVGPCF